VCLKSLVLQFSHFWSREHQDSSPGTYTYDPEAALTPEEETVNFDLEEFFQSFELEKVEDENDPSKLVDKPRWIETKMVIRGRDVAHRMRIFGE
jgi:hypothetical protein